MPKKLGISTIDADQWALYAAAGGPNTKPIYLPCHNLDDDVVQELGGRSLKFNPNPDEAGDYDIIGSTREEPSGVEFTISAGARKTKDILSSMKPNCPGGIWVMDICGKRTIFNDWESQLYLVKNAYKTSFGLATAAKKSPGDNDETTKPYGIFGEQLMEIYKHKTGRISVTEAASINGISVCNVPACASLCGQAKDLCQDLVIYPAVLGGSPTDTAIPSSTGDSGGSWAAFDTAPFAAGEDIAAGVCVELGGGDKRHIVARGTTDAGNPMEVAYSDDGGVTWTNVNVGSVNGQYALGGYSLVKLDEDTIWLVTTGGYIYASIDQGISWTAKHSASLSSEDLRAIRPVSDDVVVAVGNNDVIIVTLDGGLSWSLKTTGSGDNLYTVDAFSADNIWVGGDDALVRFTNDGGVTWGTRTFKGSGAGIVRGIEFVDKWVGYMIHNTAGPVGSIYYTVTGGYWWQRLPNQPTNAGYTHMAVCGPDMVIAVGNTVGGTGMIARAVF